MPWRAGGKPGSMRTERQAADAVSWTLRLHIGDGRTFRLFEVYFRAKKQGPQAQISQGQHDIEILVHVPVMQQVMTVKTEENSRPLDMAPPGEMHAPVHVLVGGIICRHDEGGAAENTPPVGDRGRRQEGQLADGNEHRTIPPSHRNGVLMLLVGQMISMVGLENTVMHEGVPLKRISKPSHWHMHDISVEQPLKERCGGQTKRGANAGPEQKRRHCILGTQKSGQSIGDACFGEVVG